MTGGGSVGADRVGEMLARLRIASKPGEPAGFLVTAPLRICPIGAHVDHQGGVVTGMTVDRCVQLAAVGDPNPVVTAESLDFPGRVEIDLTHGIPPKSGDWGDYLRAAARVFSRDYPLEVGFRAVIGGDLPGTGLSSSAAVLVASLLAMARVNGVDLGHETIAALVQQAENEYVGVASGRLDQSIILHAVEGCLTRVACSTGDVEQVRYPESAPPFVVLVAFSGVSRALAGSGFNARVDECREAARLLLELGGMKGRVEAVLSNVPAEVAEEHLAILPRRPRRRAAHFFGEQRRVAKGVDAWRDGDLERFGALINASGASSVHYYECGTAELVTLYQLLRDAPGVYGARFSGGGFGGSCIALVEPEAVSSIIERVSRHYRVAHPSASDKAAFHICRPGGRASVSDLED